MNPSFASAFSYLVSTLISLYATAVLLRLMLQWVRADFYNPVCQFLVKVTNPVLVPLRRIVPSIGRMDTGSVLLLLLLEAARVWLLSILGRVALSPEEMILFAVLSLAAMVLWTYFFLIIVEVVLSWVGRGSRHPVIPLIYQLTGPVLNPLRKTIPSIAGIDLSPLFALIIIRFLLLLIGR